MHLNPRYSVHLPWDEWKTFRCGSPCNAVRWLCPRAGKLSWTEISSTKTVVYDSANKQTYVVYRLDP